MGGLRLMQYGGGYDGGVSGVQLQFSLEIAVNDTIPNSSA